jgi:hypothetical protein
MNTDWATEELQLEVHAAMHRTAEQLAMHRQDLAHTGYTFGNTYYARIRGTPTVVRGSVPG